MSTQLTFDSLPASPVHRPEIVQEQPPRSMREIKWDFQDTIRQLSYTRHSWQVWQDFCELAALSLSNAMMFSEAREARYMATIQRYESKEVQLFPRLLGMVTEALEVEFQDFLGQMFMDLEMGNKWRGQFFTPYCICKMMARMSLLNHDEFDDGEIVTLNEPACGGGAMVIAACECLRDAGINFQDRLRVIAQDVDVLSAQMCYIQLSLIGCQAHVIVGNTLAIEKLDEYVTPFAVMRGWVN